MITDEEKALIRDSWRTLVPVADTVADLFYQRLFELAPHCRAPHHALLVTHKRALVSLLNFTVRALDWSHDAWREDTRDEDDLFLVMLALGRRREKLGPLRDASDEAVGAALLWALDYALGKKFDAACRAAWTRLHGLIATAMEMGKRSAQVGRAADLALDRVVSVRSQRQPGGAP